MAICVHMRTGVKEIVLISLEVAGCITEGHCFDILLFGHKYNRFMERKDILMCLHNKKGW